MKSLQDELLGVKREMRSREEELRKSKRNYDDAMQRLHREEEELDLEKRKSRDLDDELRKLRHDLAEASDKALSVEATSAEVSGLRSALHAAQEEGVRKQTTIDALTVDVASLRAAAAATDHSGRTKALQEERETLREQLSKTQRERQVLEEKLQELGMENRQLRREFDEERKLRYAVRGGGIHRD